MEKSPERRFPSAAEMHSALLSVDLGPDDAVPAVRREDTPPRGVPQTFAQSERSWIVPVFVIVVVAVTLGVVGVLFARSDTGQRLLDDPGGGGSQAEVVGVLSASAFDPPPGSGQEHDEELGFLVDGDPATTWSTEQYGNRQFGGLKSGVGFVLNLNGPRALHQLDVTSGTRGWSASVYVADGVNPSAPPGGWGEPAATRTGTDGDATFDLGGRRGSVVLVWITELGEGNAVSVGDVRLTS
jgi:serine/threonine-protein kinase